MKLTFLGGVGTVTGSKYLVEDGDRRILIDCGLFQGKKELRLQNWSGLPFAPASLHAVVLTHAHLDHSGYIPLLVKDGFKGPIYCSEATRDLCRLLLPDSGHIQEEDAESANRHGYSRHRPALPLYTEQDARRCLENFKAVSFGQRHRISEQMTFTLHHAGHILGASFVRLTGDGGTSVLFSGDIGRMNNPIMNPPAQIQDADYILVESTYGDRLHGQSDPAEDIRKIVQRTVARGGSILIPAFAVGRAQEIMFYLHELKADGRLPHNLPIYLDSPMAESASDLFGKHLADHRMPLSLCKAVCNITTYIRTREASQALDTNLAMPKIIISASGMATGGRILHHLKYYLGDQRHTVLLAGYQAEDTRGARLVRGEKEIKIHGQMWPVRAEIAQLENMSAHADSSEIMSWLKHFTRPPRKVFVTHGEPVAALSLKKKIEAAFGWEAVVPAYLQAENL